MKKTLLKIFTLSIFFSLITLFILYQARIINISTFLGSPNGGKQPQQTSDTLKYIPLSKKDKNNYLRSSKVMMVFDEDDIKTSDKKDSAQENNTINFPKEFLSSSKTAIILDENLKKELDSLILNSINIKDSLNKK
ncbi:hypothetical protein [Aureivirga sp. CE67]|uniref:hypothetical protein n=1 Tax=Aureivirga sp. CE67 TaxID=1788983 RepID=UPI0018CA7B0D|nr:hypothetical protein [Aureivirga sp. CE67]